MATAKDIVLRPVSRKEADDLVKRVHYSGKVVNNSQLHIGVFLGGNLEGVMQFGPSLDKRKIQGLVAGTGWNEFIELNRMAFTERLPRNSESRALAVAMRLIRQHAPQIKWVITFADGTQCGDGTIYRAAGFVLTGVKESDNLAQLKTGEVIHKMTLESNPIRKHIILDNKTYYEITGGKYDFALFAKNINAQILKGYQLRYIYFIDKSARKNLTVLEIPFSAIDEIGARMYKGQKPADG